MLSEDIGSLYYEASEDEWENRNISRTDKFLLDNLYSDENDVDIFFPYYKPQNILLYVLEVLYENINSDKDVVILLQSGDDHWGNKKEIRNEYEKYALDDAMGTPENPRRLSDIFSTAYIGQNGVIKTKNSDSDRDKKIVLTKKPEEIFEKLSRFDAVLIDGTSKHKFTEEMQKLRDSNTQTYSFFSILTKYYYEEKYPKYNVPEDLKNCNCVKLKNKLADDSSENLPDLQTKKLFSSKEISVRVLECGLNQHFREFAESGVHNDMKTDDKIKRFVFSRKNLLRYLPIPLRKYKKYLKTKNDERHSKDFKPVSEVFERMLRDDRTISIDSEFYDAVSELESIEEKIEDQNPKYEMAKNLIRSTLDNNEAIAIFIPKKGWREAFIHGILEDLSITKQDLRDSNIYIRGPETIREIEAIDAIVALSPIPPYFSSFYFAPNTEKIGILSYLEPDYLKENIESSRKKLNEILGEDCIPLSDVMKKGATVAVQEDSDFERVAAKNFWKALVRESSNSSSSFTSKSYRVHAKEKTLRIRPRDFVMRKDMASGIKSYEIVDPCKLEVGETFIVLSRESRKKLFERHIKKIYEEEIDKSNLQDIVKFLEIWRNGIQDIYEEFGDYSEITRKLEVNKKDSTVKNWFESVVSSDSVLETAEDINKTIGPGDSQDIKQIGKKFGKSEFLDHYEEIEAAMKALREINRNQGRNMKHRLVDSNFMEEAISEEQEYIFKSAEKIDKD